MAPSQENLLSAAVEAYKKRKEEVDATRAAIEDARYLNETTLLYSLVTELKSTSRFACTLKPCLIAKRQHPTLSVDGLVFCLAKNVSQYANEREVVLLTKCIHCSRGAYSPAIDNLEVLGQVIQEFQPTAKCNRCKDFSNHRKVMRDASVPNHTLNQTGPISPPQEVRDPTIELLQPNFNDLTMDIQRIM